MDAVQELLGHLKAQIEEEQVAFQEKRAMLEATNRHEEIGEAFALMQARIEPMRREWEYFTLRLVQVKDLSPLPTMIFATPTHGED